MVSRAIKTDLGRIEPKSAIRDDPVPTGQVLAYAAPERSHVLVINGHHFTTALSGFTEADFEDASEA